MNVALELEFTAYIALFCNTTSEHSLLQFMWIFEKKKFYFSIDLSHSNPPDTERLFFSQNVLIYSTFIAL